MNWRGRAVCRRIELAELWLAVVISIGLLGMQAPPAEANVVSDAASSGWNAGKDAVVTVLNGVETGGEAIIAGVTAPFTWTADKLLDQCDSLNACAWLKDKSQEFIQSVVDWLNNSVLAPVAKRLFAECDKFALCTWLADATLPMIEDVTALMDNYPVLTNLVMVGMIRFVPIGMEVIAVGRSGPVMRTIESEASELVGLLKTYRTSKGVEFDVPLFARLRDLCYAKGCGQVIPRELRDPRRNFTPLERKTILDRVCGPEWCEVNGRRFERKDAQIDHVIPWSCGGKTDLKNAAVLHKDDNIAKGGCLGSFLEAV